MTRTTVDLDPSVLRELRARGQREGKSMGQLASELLAKALRSDEEAAPLVPLEWASQQMRARVDLEDKEAVYRMLDG